MFSAVVLFYFFVMRHGVSRYLNSGSYKYLARRAASYTHVNRAAAKNVFKLAVLALALLAGVAVGIALYYLEYLRTQLRHVVN